MGVNRVADAIRRIVGWDATKSELAEAIARAQIGSARGIGYFQADQAVPGGVSGKGGAGGTVLGTTLPADGKASTPNNKSNDSSGNKTDANDPSQAPYGRGGGAYAGNTLVYTDPTQVTTTVQQAIDEENTVGRITSAANGGGTLNAITNIKDCATNKGVELRFDGTYEPPTTWEDPDTPPPNEEWILGQSWYRMDGGVSCILISPSLGYSASQAVANQLATTTGITTITSEGFGSAPGCPSPSGPVYVASGNNSLFGDFTWYFVRLGCTPGVSPYCPTEAPDIRWPVDGKMQLLYKDGKYVKSPREPNDDIIPSLADDKHSQLNLCLDDGTPIGLEPTANGGFMIYQTSGGSPTGIVRIFGSDGKLKGFSDVPGMAAFRPISGPTPSE